MMHSRANSVLFSVLCVDVVVCNRAELRPGDEKRQFKDREGSTVGLLCVFYFLVKTDTNMAKW